MILKNRFFCFNDTNDKNITLELLVRNVHFIDEEPFHLKSHKDIINMITELNNTYLEERLNFTKNCNEIIIQCHVVRTV